MPKPFSGIHGYSFGSLLIFRKIQSRKALGAREFAALVTAHRTGAHHGVGGKNYATFRKRQILYVGSTLSDKVTVNIGIS